VRPRLYGAATAVAAFRPPGLAWPNVRL
jgi:hypothetical protein